MTKRAISILLILLMLNGMMTVFAQAEDLQSAQEHMMTLKSIDNSAVIADTDLENESEIIASGVCGADSDQVNWCLYTDGTLRIYGTGKMKDYASIGSAPWYSYLEQITSIIIEKGVTTIGNNAFGDLIALGDIVIPDTVTRIGDYAFYFCNSLFSVDIPNVTSIGRSAFSYCTSLWEISIRGNMTEISDELFKECTNLTYVNLPDSVTSIGQSAFYDCLSMNIAPIPDNVTSIGKYAFYYCTSMVRADLPQGVKNIESYTFGYCQSLSGISVPEGVTKIGSRVFYGSVRMQAITFYGDAPTIASDAFTIANTGLTNVTLRVFYPYGNKTWNSVIGKSYGGSVIWEPMGMPAIPTLTLKAPTLEFKDMITVNAMFTAENIEDVVEMGMITYTTNVDSCSVETADHVIPGTTYDVNTDRYIATSQGIHAKYLGDTVYLACYAKLTDGSYVYTKLASYSPVQYAASKLSGTDTSLKQLVVAMLNYGAAAQTHFKHNVDNLAYATLTEDQLALPEAYRSDMVSAVPAASAEKQGAFANNKGFAKRYPSISFEGAFCINYFFTPNYAPVDGITLYYWNAADYEAVDVLSVENASGSLKLEGEGTAEYRGDITGIAAKNLSEAVYVAAVYSDGTTEWTSGVLGYSIGAYCASQSTKGGTIADLAMATAVYGYQAKQYFG